MRNLLIIISVIFYFSASLGQTKLKELKIAPQGTIWLKDNIFIDELPVSTGDYMEFLYAMAENYSKKVHDTIAKLPLYKLNWKELDEYFQANKSSVKELQAMDINYKLPLSWTNDSAKKFHYFNSEEYSNYPLVNVSYEQAVEYCKWRTDITMLSYAVSSKNEKTRNYFYKRIRFRLPTKEELEYALKQTREYNEPFTMALTDEDFSEEQETIQFIPGNISEIISEKGTAIGISWKDLDKELQNNLTYPQKYDGPKDWLGFRCVCEIIEE
jgi:formylglycine-generating enzyme required for sulfatase activity